MFMSFLTMLGLLAFWLGGLFLLVGVIWLLIRKLNRIENMLRHLATVEQRPFPETSDKPLVRRLVVTYVAVLVVLSPVMMLMMALPVGESVGTSEPARVKVELP